METVTVAGGRVVIRCGTQVHLDVSETSGHSGPIGADGCAWWPGS